MPSLVDYDRAGLEAELISAGHKPAHAMAILRRFYESNGQLAPDAIGGSKAVRSYLKAQMTLRRSGVSAKTVAADGTTKLLIALDAGGTVESVMMPGFRAEMAAGCVSSQIGCAMGCDFCASTRGGLERNLDAGEIVERFLHLKAEARCLGRRLTSLVFMGMGEPM